MYELLSVLALLFGVTAFGVQRLVQYLRFLQQEEYDVPRFLRWVWEQRFFDRKGSGLLLAAAMLVSLTEVASLSSLLVILLFSVLLVVVPFLERDPRKAGKITLKMTKRAKGIRIAAAQLFFIAVILGCWVATNLPWGRTMLRLPLVELIVIQATPLVLSLAVLLLEPAEKKVKEKFLNEAKEKFKRISPYVIGITGSYGKTSTKAVLGNVLEVTLGPTFWPSKGINTEMGITREIREQMNEGHRYAVIEMGAYRRGSIERLCRLTPPNAAIITAVGLMHLDRMGGAENVLLAKSELAQQVPDDGVLVCNGDNEGAREIAKRHPKKTTILYGLAPEKGGLSCWAEEIRFAADGTHFTLCWEEQRFPAQIPLHGRPALSNVLAGFAMAVSLGADPEYTLAALRSLKPVSNRLEVQTYPGYLQINDAYNSNPEGFAAALEVLAALPGKRKILVTPGMIELGEEQYEENKRLAKQAARSCDLSFIVGTMNKEALSDGLKEGGFREDAIRYFENRDAALAELGRIRQADDVVLLENDLPDLYELDITL